MNDAQFADFMNRLGGNKKKLPPFKSGDANTWIEWRTVFSNVAELNGWNEATQKQQLKAAMEGFAALAVGGIAFGNHHTIGECLDLYEAKFITTAQTVAARQMFLGSRQREDETLVAWHTRLITLYRRSDPDQDMEASRELLERFVLGLAHPLVRERTFDAQPATMTDALAVASQKLATLASVGADKAAHNMANRMGIHSVGDDKRPPLRCYLCDSPEHLKRDCPRYRPGKGPYKGGKKKNSSRNNSNNNGRQQSRPKGRGEFGSAVANKPFRIQALATEEEEPHRQEEETEETGNE